MYAHNPQPLDGWLTDSARFVGNAIKSQFVPGTVAAPIQEPEQPSFLQRYGLLLAAGAVGVAFLASRK